MRLDRVAEVFGSQLSPAVPALVARLDVEAVIDFDGQKLAAVVGQPVLLRHIFRIEPFPPVLVLPARRPDPETGHRSGGQLLVGELGSFGIKGCLFQEFFAYRARELVVDIDFRDLEALF